MKHEKKPLLTDGNIQVKYDDKKTGSAVRSPERRDKHLTVAYEAYEHRLVEDYKVLDNPENASMKEIEQKIEMIAGNTNNLNYEIRKLLAVICCPTIIGTIFTAYYASCEKLIVPANSFALVKDSSGPFPQTKVYGPGFHVLSPFHKEDMICEFGKEKHVVSTLNDFHLLIVDQGEIALFYYNGQPKLFGPGLHKFNEPMTFKKFISLDNPYIEIGPEKWLTVPDGYDAVVIDQGKVKIYPGGKLYHLDHKLINLAKLVPTIIQTDRIVKDVPKYIEHLNNNKGILPTQERKGNTRSHYDTSYLLDTKTKDNTEVYLDAMLYWEIENTEKAAKKLMNLIEVKDSTVNIDEHLQMASRNINYLRETVLRIAKAELTAQVGKMSVVDSQSLAAGLLKSKSDKEEMFEMESKSKLALVPANQPNQGYAILEFLNEKKDELLKNLNAQLNEYGIKVNNVAIFDAILTQEIQKELDKQVEAKIKQITEIVEARTESQKQVIEAETELKVAEKKVETDKLNKVGIANNNYEEAQIRLKTKEVEGKTEARYDEEVAKGKKNAADLLSENPLSEKLALFQAASDLANGFNSGNQTTSTYVLNGNPIENIASMFGNISNLFMKPSPDNEKHDDKVGLKKTN